MARFIELQRTVSSFRGHSSTQQPLCLNVDTIHFFEPAMDDPSRTAVYVLDSTRAMVVNHTYQEMLVLVTGTEKQS